MEEYPSPGSDGTSRNSYCRHWQIQEARRAFSQFGKDRHRAGLNYGDCFAYALARANGQSLLFKGDDFPRTDITPTVQPGTG